MKVLRLETQHLHTKLALSKANVKINSERLNSGSAKSERLLYAVSSNCTCECAYTYLVSPVSVWLPRQMKGATFSYEILDHFIFLFVVTLKTSNATLRSTY